MAPPQPPELQAFWPLLFGMEPATVAALVSFSRPYSSAQLALFPELAAYVASGASRRYYPDAVLLISRAFHLLGLKMESLKIDLIKIAVKAGDASKSLQGPGVVAHPAPVPGPAPSGELIEATRGAEALRSAFVARLLELSHLEQAGRLFVKTVCASVMEESGAADYLHWPEVPAVACGEGMAAEGIPPRISLGPEVHSAPGGPRAPAPALRGCRARGAFSGPPGPAVPPALSGPPRCDEERIVFQLSCLRAFFSQVSNVGEYLPQDVRLALSALPLLNSTSVLKELKSLVLFLAGRAYAETLTPRWARPWKCCVHPLSVPAPAPGSDVLHDWCGRPPSADEGEASPERLWDASGRSVPAPVSIHDILQPDRKPAVSRQSADCLALSLFSLCLFLGLPIYKEFLFLLDRVENFPAGPGSWCSDSDEVLGVAVSWALLSLFAQSGTMLLLEKMICAEACEAEPWAPCQDLWCSVAGRGFSVLTQDYVLGRLQLAGKIVDSLAAHPNVYVYVARVGKDREGLAAADPPTAPEASDPEVREGGGEAGGSDGEDGPLLYSDADEWPESPPTSALEGLGPSPPAGPRWDSRGSYHIIGWALLRCIGQVMYSLPKSYEISEERHTEAIARFLWALSPTYQTGLSQEAAAGLEATLTGRFAPAALLASQRRPLPEEYAALTRGLPLDAAQWFPLWAAYRALWSGLFARLFEEERIPLLRRGGATPLCIASLISALVRFPGSLGGPEQCRAFIGLFGIRTVHDYERASPRQFYLLPRQPGVFLAQGIVFWLIEKLGGEDEVACAQALQCLWAIASRLPVPVGGKGVVLCEELLFELYSAVLRLLRRRAHSYVIRNGCYLLAASALRRASSLRGMSAVSLCACDRLYEAMLGALRGFSGQGGVPAPGAVPDPAPGPAWQSTPRPTPAPSGAPPGAPPEPGRAETCLLALQLLRVCTPKTGPGPDGNAARYAELASACLSLLASPNIYIRTAAARALPAFYGRGAAGLLGLGPVLREALRAPGEGAGTAPEEARQEAPREAPLGAPGGAARGKANLLQASVFCLRAMLRAHDKGTGEHLLLEASAPLPLRLGPPATPQARNRGGEGSPKGGEGRGARGDPGGAEGGGYRLESPRGPPAKSGPEAEADILETLACLRGAARGTEARAVEVLAAELRRCGVASTEPPPGPGRGAGPGDPQFTPSEQTYSPSPRRRSRDA